MLDRVFAFYPDGMEGSAETLWGKQVLSPALSTMAEPLEDGGRVYRPVSEMTVRLRFRTDVSTHARLIDQEGRVWRIGAWSEVGRRHFLDISVATYTLPEPSRAGAVAPPVPAGELPGDPYWVPPTGWNLEWRGGAGHTDGFDPPRFVRELELNSVVIEGDWTFFDVVVPPPGWAVAAGLRQWFDNQATVGRLDRVRAETDRLRIAHLYVKKYGGGSIDRVASVAGNEMREGTTFPAADDGVFAVLGGAAVGDSLVTGDVVRLLGPGD